MKRWLLILRPTPTPFMSSWPPSPCASALPKQRTVTVFDRYLVPLYKQASFKPYIIAAMILMSQVKDPVNCLRALDAAGGSRKRF